jgi:inner membrane protein
MVAATLGLSLGLVMEPSGNGWLAGTVLAGIGGLLPDIDEPKSLIGYSPRILARGATDKSRRGSLPRVLIRVIGELLTGFVQALATVIRELTGHRGATHWLLAALVVALPAGILLGLHVGLYLAVGYLSHLALDMLTRSGIPLLGPFSKRRLHLLPKPLRARTGGPLDHFIQFAAGLAYVALLAWANVVGDGPSWLNFL